VPVLYLTNSTLKGIFDFTIQTITVPLIGGAWSTLISPPLSLVGHKPSMSRVDGFWVKALTNEQVLQAEASDGPIFLQDGELLSQSANTLDHELKPFEKEYVQIRARKKKSKKSGKFRKRKKGA